MKILVTGAAGMIGRKFCERLARDGRIGDKAVSSLRMVDVVAPAQLAGASFATSSEAANIADATLAPRLMADRPDLIVHLAAIVSGEAEVDFEKGYAVNLDGSRYIFDAIRAENILSEGAYRPRVVYASSVAVFGAPFPDPILDDFHLTPLTSYGAQKAAGELLLADYTRKGLFDGIGLRFPTICVRPGRPNAAASGSFPTSSASRSSASARSCPCRSRCAIRTPPRAPRWVSSCMRRRSTVRRSGRVATSRCPACPSPWASRSRRCGAWPARPRSR